MRLLLPVAAVVLVLGAAWCAGWKDDDRALPDAGSGTVTAEDLRVYSAVLTWQQRQNPLLGPLVVQRETEPPFWPGDPVPTERRLFDELAGELPGVRRATVRALLQRARKPGQMDVPLLNGVSLIWITRADFYARGWRSGLLRSGVWMLSSVGYDRTHEQALVYLTYACPLCGEGKYVLLRKGVHGWRVTAQFANMFS